jgi:hypothetical protein
MKPNMRRHLPGTFHTQVLGTGAWRLSRSEPGPIDVFLRGADPDAAEALRLPTPADVEIEWRPGMAVLCVTSAARRRVFKVQSAIVHEPLAQLYDALPLKSFDAEASSFWRRVFALVRIPGGRYLLGVLARRSRGRQ